MDSFCSLFNGMIHFRFSGLTSAGQTGMCCSALSFGNKPLIHSGTCITRQGDGSFVLLVPGGIRIPFAQWSPETLGAGSVLPFALTNSPHFRLRRTAHRADIRLLCHSLRSCVRIPAGLKPKKNTTHEGWYFPLVSPAGFEPTTF